MDDCGSVTDGIAWLSVEDIVEINILMIERFTPGEPFGVLSQGGLESAQQRPCVHRYYKQCEDMFPLAAALGFALIQNHPFENANKRTAAQAVYEFLKFNGYELTAPSHEVVDMYENLAKHERSEEDLTDWLAYWSRDFDTSQLND